VPGQAIAQTCISTSDLRYETGESMGKRSVQHFAFPTNGHSCQWHHCKLQSDSQAHNLGASKCLSQLGNRQHESDAEQNQAEQQDSDRSLGHQDGRRNKTSNR
jgi:hypothetical protein